MLVTDAWVPKGHILGAFPGKIRERRHDGLRRARVRSFNLGILAFELASKARGLKGWDQVIARNAWFQRRVASALLGLERDRRRAAGRWERPVLFSYSYTALGPFRWAKENGWRTVLGQIDPGPMEERLVKKLEEESQGRIARLASWDRSGREASRWRPAPSSYWDSWREECRLADQIVVNSDWSRGGLVEEGIGSEKISIVPLAFDSSADAGEFSRSYPERFTSERPLRVLFLGQVNVRKGIVPLLEASRALEGEPIEFLLVGPSQIAIPENWRAGRKVRWIGSVPRSEVSRYYREADVFVFPTFSDGFGLTQLEAQSWRLPVIASRNCGDVVRDGENGWLLKEVSAPSIAEVIHQLAVRPGKLASASRASGVSREFGLETIGTRLMGIAERAL